MRQTHFMTACAVFFCTPAVALDGIQNHAVQTRFIAEPCQAVLTAIDHAAPTPEGIGDMAMTFGFLMGFEALHPGIRGTHETVLQRLRTDCQASDTRTALQILQTYADAAAQD